MSHAQSLPVLQALPAHLRVLTPKELTCHQQLHGTLETHTWPSGSTSGPVVGQGSPRSPTREAEPPSHSCNLVSVHTKCKRAVTVGISVAPSALAQEECPPRRTSSEGTSPCHAQR